MTLRLIGGAKAALSGEADADATTEKEVLFSVGGRGRERESRGGSAKVDEFVDLIKEFVDLIKEFVEDGCALLLAVRAKLRAFAVDAGMELFATQDRCDRSIAILLRRPRRRRRRRRSAKL
jgi:hypothetical protein